MASKILFREKKMLFSHIKKNGITFQIQRGEERELRRMEAEEKFLVEDNLDKQNEITKIEEKILTMKRRSKELLEREKELKLDFSIQEKQLDSRKRTSSSVQSNLKEEIQKYQQLK